MARQLPVVEKPPELTDAIATPPHIGTSVASTCHENRCPKPDPTQTVARGSMQRMTLTMPGLMYRAAALNITKPPVHTALSGKMSGSTARGAKSRGPPLLTALEADDESIAEIANCARQSNSGRGAWLVHLFANIIIKSWVITKSIIHPSITSVSRSQSLAL